jgi:hypothetical protein
MTAPRTSDVTTASISIPPTSIPTDADTRLLKKVRAIRPMLAARETRKKLAAIPAI